MGVGEGREAMASNLPEGPGEGRLIDFSTWRNKQEIPGKYSAKNCLLPPSSQQRESEKSRKRESEKAKRRKSEGQRENLHCFKFTGKVQQIDGREAVQTVNGRVFSDAIFPVDGL